MTELPKGWRMAALSEVAKWGSGGTPKGKNPRYYGGKIPWAIIGDLNDGVISQTAETITQDGIDNSSAKWVPENSVLIAMYGSIGKLGINAIPLTTNQAIAFATPDPDKATTKYLYLALMNERPRLISEGKGATQQNISQTILKPWKIPLPPLVEQERIVEVLDEQFSRLDSALASIRVVREKAAAFRRSILHSAFAEFGVASDPLSSCASVTDCEHRTAPKAEGEAFGFSIGTSSVRNGRLAFEKANPVTQATYVSWTTRRTPTYGDLILTREAPMGEVALVPESPRVCLGQRTVLISPERTRIHSNYLHLMLQAPRTQRWIASQAVGTTVPHLNVADVKSIPLGVLPNLSEQEGVVAYFEEQFSRLENALEVTNELETRIANERRSLLHSAFAGELTSKWRDAHV